WVLRKYAIEREGAPALAALAEVELRAPVIESHLEQVASTDHRQVVENLINCLAAPLIRVVAERRESGSRGQREAVGDRVRYSGDAELSGEIDASAARADERELAVE